MNPALIIFLKELKDITRDRRTNQVTEVHGTCRELPPEMRPDAPTGYVAAARQEM